MAALQLSNHHRTPKPLSPSSLCYGAVRACIALTAKCYIGFTHATFPWHKCQPNHLYPAPNTRTVTRFSPLLILICCSFGECLNSENFSYKLKRSVYDWEGCRHYKLLCEEKRFAMLKSPVLVWARGGTLGRNQASTGSTGGLES